MNAETEKLIFAGPISDAFGVQIWFLVGRVITILMALGAFFVPAIMHIEDIQAEESQLEASQEGLSASP